MKYYAIKSLEEAIKLLSETEGAIILAGGTDIIVEKRAGKISPQALIDIKRIRGLDFIRIENDSLQLGPLTTITSILESKTIPPQLKALKDAAQNFGCYEIRNRATIGGNIAHASPGAEFGSTLLALGATIELTGERGKIRKVPIKDFFTGAGKSVAKTSEIVTMIEIPISKTSASAYLRASRTDGMDLAIVNCCVFIDADNNNNNTSYNSVTAAFGAVASTPIILPEVNQLLSNGNIKVAKEFLFNNINPRATSLRAKPLTKKILVSNLLEEAFYKTKNRLQEIIR